MPQESTRTGKTATSLAPKYDDESVKLIHRFLAACLTTSEHALRRTVETAGPDKEHPLHAGQILHWQGVCKGIRWCAYKACERQPHLADTEDKDVAFWEEHFADTLVTWNLIDRTNPSHEELITWLQQMISKELVR